MTLHPIDIVAPELQSEEQVLWLGMPSFTAILMHNLPSILSGFVFTIAPFLFDRGGGASPHTSVQTTATVLFAAIGLNLTRVGVLNVLAVRSTAYAVTGRRILVIRHLIGKRVSSILPDGINIMEYKVREDGSGSVLFRKDEFQGAEASGITKSGFRGVQDVMGAVHALNVLRMGTLPPAR